MSQPDLLTQLREARPLAPAELREHVRRIAAEAAPERRSRLTWRRALVLAVPVAAAVAAGAVLLPGNGHQTSAGTGPAPYTPVRHPPTSPLVAAVGGAGATRAAGSAAAQSAVDKTAVPAPSPNRVQRIGAWLELRVTNAQSVSDDTKVAVGLARSLGGYASTVNVDAAGRTGAATIVLRIPKEHLQRAVARLSALGTIISENVSIQDLQSQVDATTAKIARLQSRLAYWQAQPQTDETQKQVVSFQAAIAKLRRGQAATVKAASNATLHLTLTTRQAIVPSAVHHGHGPLHGLGIAFRWAGIGAVYALALGGPLLLFAALGWLAARTVRRHRENELLSRP